MPVPGGPAHVCNVELGLPSEKALGFVYRRQTARYIAFAARSNLIGHRSPGGLHKRLHHLKHRGALARGGDHALHEAGDATVPEGLPDRYALALCRIEPENNVHVILEALDGLGMPLVFVGNWDNSDYGRDLKARYSESYNLFLLDPVYDPGALYAVRARASVYLHGHSAGGTNPSLVEMMHFGVPVLAHGCAFNRHSTEDKARYFESAAELAEQLRNLDPEDAGQIGTDMREIAQRKYTWDQIGKAYFELLDRA